MAASGARLPIHSSHCATPCATNISTPETVRIPRAAAMSQKFRLQRAIDHVHHQLAIQFARFQWRTPRVRMHSHWRGIDDRVEFFFPQRRAPDHPAAHRPRQLLRRILSARTNQHLRASFRHCERRRARRAPRAKNQDAAVFDLQLSLQRAQHADVICIAPSQFSVWPHASPY